LAGDEGALAGAILGAEPVGLTDADILSVGDALLLLVIESVWATGLRNAQRDAKREAGLVYVEQDYPTPEGLVALGGLPGVAAALEG
jgi:uncharacterized membrane protein YfcA